MATGASISGSPVFQDQANPPLPMPLKKNCTSWDAGPMYLMETTSDMDSVMTLAFPGMIERKTYEESLK